MFGFIATIVSLAWIAEHFALFLSILAGLVLLIIFIVHRSRKRRRAYLSLPVIFIGNKATKTYHVTDCSQLSKAAPLNLVAFRLRQEVIRYGYKPCSICRPRLPS